MTGLVRPSRGRISVLGIPPDRPEELFRYVGYCTQFDSFPKGFTGYQFVRQFDTMIIEPPIYLAALLDEIRLAGATTKVVEIHDRGEIQNLPEKLVFNCTGLGARALFADEELTPVKGQLTILLPQPEVQYAIGQGDLYMFPRTDGILLGGTHEIGVWTLDPNLEKKQEIIAQHKAFFDGFKNC